MKLTAELDGLDIHVHLHRHHGHGGSDGNECKVLEGLEAINNRLEDLAGKITYVDLSVSGLQRMIGDLTAKVDALLAKAGIGVPTGLVVEHGPPIVPNAPDAPK